MIYSRVQFRMPVTITKVPFVQIAEAESRNGEYLIEDDGPNHLAVYKTTPRVYARVPWSNVLSSFPETPEVVKGIPVTPLQVPVEQALHGYITPVVRVSKEEMTAKYAPPPDEPQGLPELPRAPSAKPNKRSK